MFSRKAASPARWSSQVHEPCLQDQRSFAPVHLGLEAALVECAAHAVGAALPAPERDESRAALCRVSQSHCHRMPCADCRAMIADGLTKNAAAATPNPTANAVAMMFGVDRERRGPERRDESRMRGKRTARRAERLRSLGIFSDFDFDFDFSIWSLDCTTWRLFCLSTLERCTRPVLVAIMRYALPCQISTNAC